MKFFRAHRVVCGLRAYLILLLLLVHLCVALLTGCDDTTLRPDGSPDADRADTGLEDAEIGDAQRSDSDAGDGVLYDAAHPEVIGELVADGSRLVFYGSEWFDLFNGTGDLIIERARATIVLDGGAVHLRGRLLCAKWVFVLRRDVVGDRGS